MVELPWRLWSRPSIGCYPGPTWRSWSSSMMMVLSIVPVTSGDGLTNSPGEKCYQNLSCYPSERYTDIPSKIVKCGSGASTMLQWMVAPTCSTTTCASMPRIQLVLTDQSRPEPNYLHSWYLFLPSELCLNCTCLDINHLVVAGWICDLLS